MDNNFRSEEVIETLFNQSSSLIQFEFGTIFYIVDLITILETKELREYYKFSLLNYKKTYKTDYKSSNYRSHIINMRARKKNFEYPKED